MKSYPRRNARLAWSVFAVALIAAADLVILGIALDSRVELKIGALTILRASDYWQPMALAAVSVLGLVALHRGAWVRRLFQDPRFQPAVVVCMMTAMALAGILGPHIIHGDGRDYILQTQSLVFDRSLSLHPAERREYWNEKNPYEISLGQVRDPRGRLGAPVAAGGGFGGYYADRFGDYRNYHYWFYPAIVAPLYALLHTVNPNGYMEYMSFRYMNVFFLFLFVFACYRLKPAWTSIALLFLMFFTPLVPYCDWQHPELMCLSLTMLSFALAGIRGWRYVSPLLLGVAGAHNLPIMLFFPFHLFLSIVGLERKRWPAVAGLGAGYLAGAALGLSSIAWNMYFFGTPSLISKVGAASLHHATLGRALDIFFSPMIGAAWFFPAAVFVLPACLSRRNLLTVSFAVLSVLSSAWLASSAANFNAGQVGAVRYAVWLLAPLWYCVFRFIPAAVPAGWRKWALFSGIGLSAVLVLYLGSERLMWKDIMRAGGCRRARAEIAAVFRVLAYNDDPETLVENIRGSELQHSGRYKDVYLWDLGKGEYLWVLPEVVVRNRIPIEFEMDDPGLLRLKAMPAQEVSFDVHGNTVTILLSRQRLSLRHHSVLGRYMTIRSSGRIRKVLVNQRYTIKSSRIQQVRPADTGGSHGVDADPALPARISEAGVVRE
jgi:hypothetical protein